MNKKVFPIKTETACQLKWAWSTLFLNTGITNSCHRTSESVLTPENFFEFHNTPVKIKDRKSMLRGEWPEESCGYCRRLEEAGSVSDRIRMASIPNLYPDELDTDSTLTQIEPSIMEVYFSNACNLGCLYCNDRLSSTIDAENRKFGPFNKGGVEIVSQPGHYKELLPYFWQWFETGFTKVKRFHVLGGEPLYQKEFFKLLDMIEKHPNPNCELNLVTNLMVDYELVKKVIGRFKDLILKKAVKRVDLTCSIDCWGPEIEYVRYGFKMEHWLKNFNYLLEQKWLKIHTQQVITPLTLPTADILVDMIKEWRKDRPVGHYFGLQYPRPDYFDLSVLGEEALTPYADQLMAAMPEDNNEDKLAKEYMAGMLNVIKGTTLDVEKFKQMIIFLDEKDRRRGNNWRLTFPWIAEIEKNVV